jgi:hypothetical protein
MGILIAPANPPGLPVALLVRGHAVLPFSVRR